MHCKKCKAELVQDPINNNQMRCPECGLYYPYPAGKWDETVRLSEELERSDLKIAELTDEALSANGRAEKYKAKMEKAKHGFDSITCLCCEGPEFHSKQELIETICKEAMKYYKEIEDDLP